MAVKKPKPPRLTGNSGISRPAMARAAANSVPSPPKTITSCVPSGTCSRASPSGLLMYRAASLSSRVSTPRSRHQATNPDTIADARGIPGLAMTPTALMSGMQKELLIAFRSQHGRGNHLRMEAQCLNGLFHATAGLKVQSGIANNSSLAYLMPFQLELRLHQNNHFRVAGEKSGQGR